MSLKYRPDIDGLRTLAVIPVILFHFGLDQIKGFHFAGGGFVGVDIFFVISGFLISRIIYEQIDYSRYDVVGFYVRRAKRIFPALFAVYIFCAIVVSLTGVGQESTEVRNSIFSSLFFVSNLFFASKAGYFGGELKNNPLLHTWSLSVEEQFYVLFPLLVMALRRMPHRARLIALTAVLLSSLCYSEYLVRTQPDVAYYSLFARAWELMIGSMLAIANPAPLPRRWAEAEGLAGIAMLGLAIATYGGTVPFPGFSALLPCLGTALIIHSGTSSQTMTARFLAAPPLRFTGLISYSLYLWHWPLLVFYELNFPSDRWSKLVLFVVCYAVSTLSWRFIEQPVRRFKMKNERASTIKASSIAAASVLVVATAATPLNAAIHPKTPLTQKIENFAGSYKVSEIMRDGSCFISSKYNSVSYYQKDYCLAHAPEDRTVLLVGDSHAAQYWKPFEESLPRARTLQASASGCLPLLNTKGERRCVDLWTFITREYLPRHHVGTIVLAGLWTPDTVDRAVSTAASLRAYADHVAIIGPNPTYDVTFPRLLMLAQQYGESATARHVETVPRDVDARFRAIPMPTGVTYLSYYAAMCAQGCPSFAANGDPSLFDGNHLTVAAGNDVVRRWAEAGMLP